MMKIANADLKGSIGELSLQVTVIAPTQGWNDIKLTEVEYITPPEDGIQDIILLGTPPNGPAATSEEIINLSILLKSNDWFQGVRIRDKNGNQIWSLRNPTLKQEPVGVDIFSMEPISIEEDKLIIHIHYGGGCKNHTFQLNWDGNIIKTNPPKVELILSHNSNGDLCKALLRETIQYDLSTLPDFPQEEMVILLKSPGRSYELNYFPPL